ncbi:hypothetical protein ACFU1R_20290 [Priestia megaterium]|uniref:hypothetical protein n=1 Tax=Priestia megaterium TaxID=1404 RepID=UPI00366DD20D
MNNEENNDGYDFDLEHEAMAGEIVEVSGYEGFWRVDCVNIELSKYATEQFTDIYYDVYNIHTNEYLIAGDEDVTLVADAASADDFVANMAAPERKSIDPGEPKIVPLADLFEQFRKTKEAENMAKENRKLTPREQSAKVAAEKKAARKKKAEMVDRALDGRLALTDAIEVFPEDKAKYERKIAKYDAFLAKVSDGE